MVRFCLKRALRVGKMLASHRCSVSALGSQGFQAAFWGGLNGSLKTVVGLTVVALLVRNPLAYNHCFRLLVGMSHCHTPLLVMPSSPRRKR